MTEKPCDGVINEEEWKNNRLGKRILWVLKETNEYPGDLRKLLRDLADSPDPNIIYPYWKNTYGAVVKVSHGILNESIKWGEWAEDVNKIKLVLHKIAVMNVNKASGGKTTDMMKLKRDADEKLLLRQIDALDPSPDIIILGGVGDIILKPNNDTKRKWVIVGHPMAKAHEKYYKQIVGQLKS